MPDQARTIDYRDLALEDYAVQVANLEAVTTELATRTAMLRELLAASWGYTRWLQRELGRARQWSALEVLDAWGQELDVRAQQRSEIDA